MVKKVQPYLIMAGVFLGLMVLLSFARPFIKNLPLLNRI
jgi:hypothetical protein